MDLATIAESLNEVTLSWWPYFDLVHCILACISVRDELGPDALAFSRKHPLSTYLSCMLTIFAGGLICNPLLGEPVLGALIKQEYVLMATVVWYLTFNCPFDIYVTICKVFPVKVVLSVMKEIYRAKKVTSGVSLAAKVYPGNYLIMIIIGTIKGNGSAFMKIIAGLFRGTWDASKMEVVTPSFQTKGCLIASVLFILTKDTNLITLPHTLVCIGVANFFVYSKLVSLFDIHKPTMPFEAMFCYLFCGGIIASLEEWSVSVDGANEGSVDGANEGSVDGANEGSVDGANEGSVDGANEGSQSDSKKED